MEITDVRIRKIDAEGKMKAVVSVTFDNEFVIHDIKVIESLNGLFIAMPSRKTPDGEFKDIAHPINAAAREKIQSIILGKYESLASETSESTTSYEKPKVVEEEKEEEVEEAEVKEVDDGLEEKEEKNEEAEEEADEESEKSED